MAKMKSVGGGANTTIMPASPFMSPRVFDNRPDGPSKKPNDDIDGCYYPKGKMKMCDLVARGEGKDGDQAILQTANGTQKSHGQNPDQQMNWSPDSSWSEDEKWDGGNLTGL